MTFVAADLKSQLTFTVISMRPCGAPFSSNNHHSSTPDPLPVSFAIFHRFKSNSKDGTIKLSNSGS